MYLKLSWLHRIMRKQHECVSLEQFMTANWSSGGTTGGKIYLCEINQAVKHPVGKRCNNEKTYSK